MSSKLAESADTHLQGALTRYYRLHAPIYDATRWAFLFGRQRLLDEVGRRLPAPARVLEVGVGTGRNLDWAGRRWSQAQLTGVDLSPGMLAQARKRLAWAGPRLTLHEAAFNASLVPPQDLVILSYVVTMAGPERLRLVQQAVAALAPGGWLAIVDFDATAVPAFRRWMRVNHVEIDASLRPAIEALAPAEHALQRKAYGGLWRWFLHLHRAPAGRSADIRIQTDS